MFTSERPLTARARAECTLKIETYGVPEDAQEMRRPKENASCERCECARNVEWKLELKQT